MLRMTFLLHFGIRWRMLTWSAPSLICLNRLRNSCLNALRKRLNANKYSDSSIKEKTDLLNYSALESSGFSRLYEVDVESIISKGMTMMKPKVRRTFVMSRFKGLKNREIAGIEGVGESTIEARITAALLIMKRLLKDYID